MSLPFFKKTNVGFDKYLLIFFTDEKIKWEGQKTINSDEQRTQDTTRQNKSTCKIRRSGRKSMSPFSTLYEFMKHKVDTKPTEESVSDKISAQQKTEYSPRKDSINTAASQTPHRISTSGQTIQTEDTTSVILENFEQPIDSKNQGINMIISNPMYVEGNSSRQSCDMNERQDREDINLHFQNIKESEDSEIIKSCDNDTIRSNSGGLSTSASSVALKYTEKAIGLSTEIDGVEVKTNLNTSGSVESVLPRSETGGENLETCSSPSSRHASGMLQTELDPLIELKRTVDISTEAEDDIMPVKTGEEECNVLIENLKTNGKNKSSDIKQTLDAQILEETKTESDQLQERNFETITCLVQNNDNKSPRRSSRHRRNFSDAGSRIVEESSVTGKDGSSFKGVPEENTVKYWPQETDGYMEERPTTKSLEDSFVVKNIAGSSSLPESCPKSHLQMPAEDVVQEENVSSQCNIKKQPGKWFKSHYKIVPCLIALKHLGESSFSPS